MTKSTSLAALAALTILLASCSSAPKRPPEIFTNRNAASGQLDLANRAAAREDFVNAHLFLNEAWNLAVSTDDPIARVRVQLARGNAFFNEGLRDKAALTWQTALTEAQGAHLKTETSAAKLYMARGKLPEGDSAAPADVQQRKGIASEVKAQAQAELPNFKGNVLYTAFAWKVIGLAEKEIGNAKAAEEALMQAVSLHEKNRYLEDAAYDWYLIASVRSKNGQFTQALTALDKAIAFDRRAENTNGLGMSWMAVGMVQEKMGNPDKAAYAYGRAADIFASGFMGQNEKAARAKLNSIQ